MDKLQVLDLFSGIGGFSLGLERTGGFETVAFCEIEEYPQQVLAKHWPGVPIYDDVRELTAERLASDGIGVDVITGGFPCQDISTAGKQAGISDGTRSGLWSECARLLGELQPKYAIFENVTALISGESGRWFEQVLWDISQVGYDAEWHCIPASALGASHRRDRVWIIAYPTSGIQSISIDGSEPEGSGETSPQGAEFTSGRGGEQDVADPLCRRKRDSETINKPALDKKRHNAAPGKGRAPLSSEAGGDGSLADNNGRGCDGSGAKSKLFDTRPINKASSWWTPEPAVGRVANGVPDRTHRLKSLGNAVVPQIPELIGRAILNG